MRYFKMGKFYELKIVFYALVITLTSCQTEETLSLTEELSRYPPNKTKISYSNKDFGELLLNQFSIVNLTKLQSIKLQNCSIRNYQKNTFEKLIHLEELDLYQNKLKKLFKDTFNDNNNLILVNFGYNEITIIEDGVFFNLKSLKNIYLNRNRIEKISNNTFVGLSQLRYLALEHNNIKHITFDFSTISSSLDKISLENNPWLCNDGFEKFKNNISKISNLSDCTVVKEMKETTTERKIAVPTVPTFIISSKENSNTDTNFTLIIGLLVVIMLTLLVSIITIYYYCIVKKRRNKRNFKEETEVSDENESFEKPEVMLSTKTTLDNESIIDGGNQYENNLSRPDLLQMSPKSIRSLSSKNFIYDFDQQPLYYKSQPSLRKPALDTLSLRSNLYFADPRANRPVRANQGYMIIPRNNRQSWNGEFSGTAKISAPSSPLLYDNLGIRRDRLGSSNSLNKSENISARLNRMNSNNCDTIDENHLSEYSTLPRNMNNELSPFVGRKRRNRSQENDYMHSLPSSYRKKTPPIPLPKPKMNASLIPQLADYDGTAV